jgi:hypothetical protein
VAGLHHLGEADAAEAAVPRLDGSEREGGGDAASAAVPPARRISAPASALPWPGEATMPALARAAGLAEGSSAG